MDLRLASLRKRSIRSSQYLRKRSSSRFSWSRCLSSASFCSARKHKHTNSAGLRLMVDIGMHGMRHGSLFSFWYYVFVVTMLLSLGLLTFDALFLLVGRAGRLVHRTHYRTEQIHFVFDALGAWFFGAATRDEVWFIYIWFLGWLTVKCCRWKGTMGRWQTTSGGERW